MRVQLEGQALRLRIEEPELERLLAGATLDNATHWPDGGTTHQELKLDGEHGWRRREDGWCVALADAAVRDLAVRLPSREGLKVEVPVAGAPPLRLLFDVDVRDRARRRRTGKQA